MLTILVVSKDEKRCKGLAVRLAKEAGAYVHVIGPTPAAVSKVKDYYRYMIYLKSLKEEPIRQAKERLEALINGFEFRRQKTLFLIMSNYSEPCKIAFCDCLHSYRIAILYGEVTT